MPQSSFPCVKFDTIDHFAFLKPLALSICDMMFSPDRSLFLLCLLYWYFLLLLSQMYFPILANLYSYSISWYYDSIIPLFPVITPFLKSSSYLLKCLFLLIALFKRTPLIFCPIHVILLFFYYFYGGTCTGLLPGDIA